MLWFSVVVGRPVTSVNDHFGSNCPNEGAVIEGVPPHPIFLCGARLYRETIEKDMYTIKRYTIRQCKYICTYNFENYICP